MLLLLIIFQCKVMWFGHVQAIWQKDVEVGTGRQEAERRTRQEIYGCGEREHDVRRLELMEVNDCLCPLPLPSMGRAQLRRGRGLECTWNCFSLSCEQNTPENTVSFYNKKKNPLQNWYGTCIKISQPLRSLQWWLNGHSHQGELRISTANKNLLTAFQWRPSLYDPCHSTPQHRHLKENLGKHFRRIRVWPALDDTRGPPRPVRGSERTVIIPRVSERCLSPSPRCSLPSFAFQEQDFPIRGS